MNIDHHDHQHTWEEAQAEEAGFWGDCGNTLGEEMKQLVYAKYLGLEFYHDGISPYYLDFHDEPALDVGGGPVSLLLKARRQSAQLDVADPCAYPMWTMMRYHEAGIRFLKQRGEDLTELTPNYYGTVLMYNVLQHTESPQDIFTNIYRALKPGGTFRFFDWIDTPTNTAHPLSLHLDDLAGMLKTAGFNPTALKQVDVNENCAVGKAAYGVFTKKV